MKGECKMNMNLNEQTTRRFNRTIKFLTAQLIKENKSATMSDCMELMLNEVDGKLNEMQIHFRAAVEAAEMIRDNDGDYGNTKAVETNNAKKVADDDYDMYRDLRLLYLLNNAPYLSVEDFISYWIKELCRSAVLGSYSGGWLSKKNSVLAAEEIFRLGENVRLPVIA